MGKSKFRVTLADKVLIGFSVCLVAASVVVARSASGQGGTVLIEVDGRTVYKLSLGESEKVTLDGIRGKFTVESREGRVAMINADCPNHICMRTGWRSRSGEMIVCVPNKVVVRILPKDRGRIRATTG